MSRVWRWLGYSLAGVTALALLAGTVLWAASERVLRKAHPVPVASLAVPVDAASIAEGRRLAIAYGCYSSCHGRGAEGQVMIDEPLVGRIVAPDLTASVRRYDAATLSAIVRHGVRPDGHGALVMPSEAYAPMSDADLGRIVAFLRSLPAAHGPGPQRTIGPLGRLGLVTGQFKTAAALLETARAAPGAHDAAAERGRYLAQVACGHCHGPDLRGTSNPSFTSPDLHAVSAYSAEAFAALMRTGTALGGRDLGIMSRWARSNLSSLNDDEVAALHAYLSAMGQD